MFYDVELYPQFQNSLALSKSFAGGLEKTEETVIKRYFLVDYENVSRQGLNGISGLTENDGVRIYYSDTAQSLSFELHECINSSKAHFEYIKVRLSIKNAIDCRLLFDVFDLTEQNRDAQYFIVSKDTDYDKSIKELCEQNFKVKKIFAVCDCDFEDIIEREYPYIDEDELHSFLEQHFNEQDKYADEKEAVFQIILYSKSKEKLYNRLLVLYDEITANVVFEQLSSLIKYMPEKNIEPGRERRIRSFFEANFNKQKKYVDKKEEIINLILNSKSKTELYEGLLKLYGKSTVNGMLGGLRNLIKDIPGDLPFAKAKKSAVANNLTDEQVRSFFDANFIDEEYSNKKNEIIRIVLNSKTRHEINLGLLKLLKKGALVSSVMKKLKPLTKNIPGG